MGKNILLISLLGIVMVSFSFATQIESFDYASDGEIQAAWIVAGNDIGVGSATVYTSLSDKQEGTGAAKFVYNYSGRQWYEAYMRKNLTTPIDLSEAKRFSFWINVEGDDLARDNVFWYLRFYTPNNHVWRYVDWVGLGAAGWKQMNFSALAMEPDRWVSGSWGAYGDSAIISQVTAIQILLQQKAGIPATPGTATVYFDDMQYYTDNPAMGQTAIDRFNYADNSSLQAEWLVTIPTDTPGFVLAVSTSSNMVEGSTSMKMDYHIVDYWRNVRCEKTLAQPTDFSNVSCFKMWVYGDYSIPTTQPLMMLTVQDVNTCRASARIRYSLKTSMWQCLWIQNKYAVNTSTLAPFFQDQWDSGGVFGDVDRTQILKIGLYTQGSRQYEEYSFTCYIDDILAGFPITPLSVSAGSGIMSVGASLPVSASDGIAPYTWSLSSTSSVTSTAVGYIDGTSGLGVTFYSTATGEVDIYCWDNNIPATLASAHLSIVPTTAPLYRDLTENVGIIRSAALNKMGWELFQ